jgi:flagellar protein FlaI
MGKEEKKGKKVLDKWKPKKGFSLDMKSLRGLRGALRKKLTETGKGPEYPDFPLKTPSHLVVLPKMKKATGLDVKYPLLEPLAHAHVKWVPAKKGLVYYIEEPGLNKKEKELLEKIKSDLRELIDVEISVIEKREKAIDYLEEKLKAVLAETGITLPKETYIKIIYYIIRDFVGLNEIEPLMNDPYIEDVGCDGLGIPLYIVHRKFGSVETDIVFKDLDYLNNFVIKLSERCGRYVSYAKPLMDGTLPDGSRVQVSLAKDVTTRGPTFSIRKFKASPFSPIELIDLKTASPELMAYLWLAVEHSTSLLICGGVATGKTTLLNSITMFIPPENKIVSIEDTRELNLPHQNWIPSVSRVGFGVPEASGRRYGEVSLFELLKESFRQNPDYVIVGEVRGKEAYVMFQGMSSGHPSIGTIHAGSVDDVIKRLETPPIELSPSLVETLDLIVVMVHAKEKGKSSRRVKEIVEMISVDSKTGKAHTLRSFVWVPSDDNYESNVRESRLLREISFHKGIPFPTIMDELRDRRAMLEWMRSYGVTDFHDVCRMINLYYKDTSTVMKWVNSNTPPKKTKYKDKAEHLWESTTGLKILKENSETQP